MKFRTNIKLKITQHRTVNDGCYAHNPLTVYYIRCDTELVLSFMQTSYRLCLINPAVFSAQEVYDSVPTRSCVLSLSEASFAVDTVV